MKLPIDLIHFVLLALLAASTAGGESGLAVYPPSINLTNVRDTQRILAIATDENGVTTNVTGELELKFAVNNIAAIAGNLVAPTADGDTQLTATWNGQSVSVPVTVKHAKSDPPLSFRLDVMPVITRAGCNTGTCHGSARGKDGFGLSLFGFDPAGDYHRITRELAARRINLARPTASLLLEKAIGAVQHTGGKRFDAESDHYRTMHRWLEEGANNDSKEIATVESVTIYPPEILIQGIGGEQSLLAVAKYSDGTDRDITDLAVFFSSDEGVATVDGVGAVSALSRGESFISARFETHTVGVPVLVLPDDLEYTAPAVTGNYVDELVATKLRKLRVPPSPICTDEEFLRRVTVDVVGLLPTESEYAAFLADESEDKRARKIEALLNRDEFADLWAAKWADLLMIRQVNNQVSEKAVLIYFDWLKDQIKNNTPLDEMVRQLLSTSGPTFETPPANFYAVERDKKKTAENVAQIFLGIRTQCAQCHNHPFDRWTMDDYYGFAAFFVRVARKQHEDPRQWIIFSGGGETRHPVGNAVVPPKFLGGEAPEIPKARSRRDVVAEWVTSADNPYFARTTANRIWAHFLGKGIIEPVDDVRVSNPPSNAALLDALAERLVESKYDFRKLATDILTSEAYQRSSKAVAGNEHDTLNFARASVRRIPAVNLLDCISQATDRPSKYPRKPMGTRAVETPDPVPGNYFLKTFGRATRATACACETNSEPTLSQALHLLNGDSVHGKIRQGQVIRKMVSSKKTPAEILQSIYVRCLGRQPTEQESEVLLAKVGKDNVADDLEDIFWAVLNSREFLFLK
jgi:hypothetical protein